MKDLEKEKYIPVLFVLIYLVIILYITLFCRSSGLLRSCKLEPFYSYIVWYRSGVVWNRQLLFNIALFVPFGYFLVNALQSWNIRRTGKLTVGISFLFSVAIETIQYFSCLGMCDFDDVIHNVLGACLGVAIYNLLVRCSTVERLSWWKIILSLLFLIAGAVGCNIAYNFEQKQPNINNGKVEYVSDKYRVFERALPSEYNITAVTVGFNTDGKITWTGSFRVEK